MFYIHNDVYYCYGNSTYQLRHIFKNFNASWVQNDNLFKYGKPLQAWMLDKSSALKLIQDLKTRSVMIQFDHEITLNQNMFKVNKG